MRKEDRKREHPVTDEDIIMEIAAVASRESIIREFEEIANDPNAPDISPEAAASLHNSVMDSFAQYRKKQARKKALRRVLRVAACFVVLFISLSIVVFKVDAARVAVVNYVIKTFPQYSEIHYDVESNAYPPLGWTSPYYPTWLPEGTKVTQIQIEDQSCFVWYEDKDGYEFYFSVMSESNQIPAIDTENKEKHEILILDNKATMLYDEKRGIRSLILVTKENILVIQGAISESDAIKIGENIIDL